MGTVVTITGSNFVGVSAVTFNLTPASYTVVSSTQIQATVPAGASTGRIRVTTAGGTATSGSDFTVTTPPPPTTLTFIPPHDAWVRSSSPSSNFGARPELSVRGGNQTTRSYLKFNVSGVTGAVQSATLRLRVIDAGPDGGSVFSVSNNFAGTSTPWTESGLTWNNAPAPSGSALDAAGSVSVNTWVELDVTSAITGNGTFSFALTGARTTWWTTAPPRARIRLSSSWWSRDPPRSSVWTHRASKRPRCRVRSALYANHPNPFSGGTTILYALPRPMPVRLAIYDITGRKVRTLVNGIQSAGESRVTWDGRDEHGARVSAGVYIYRLEAAATRLTRRMS